MGYSDDQIRGAVINLFKKYDKNNSGYVDAAQVNAMCNDLARELSSKKNYTNEEITSVLSTLDRNQDGKITMDELYMLMRKLNPE